VAEAITNTTIEGNPPGARRLHPGLAFFCGVLGLGYLYVGRLGYAIGFAVAPYAFMLAMGWTRLLVDPFGWYAYFPGIIGLWLVQVVHPTVIAWSRPLAPAKAYNRWWWYIAWLMSVWLLSLVVIPERGSALGYEFFTNPSGSMTPTLQPGDMVVVDTWRYRSVPPQFGEIVVFRDDEDVNLVKRVVGLPGDLVEVRGTSLVRNGAPASEPYLGPPREGAQMRDFPPLTLGDDEFFVLGDYRNNSRDSRHMGPIPLSRMTGRVEFIGFSLSDGIRWERFATRLADE
jgi:signal peptidase I